MSNILEVRDISKQYRLGLISTGTISHDLNRWWHRVRGKEDPYLKIGETNDRANKGTSDYVWALKDISFDVKPGEVLGIIGRNGAGKSTLLKILSRVTGPTTGSIKSYGRIASLLEVGTGFHPELTGRENIFLNGAILGMTKQEIRKKFDEIVDFAGCERYIETPVKRYSSGMYVRLAFAVAAHLEPEILVVDEVLAVGDAEFQKKAIGKMKAVAEGEGRTVLFVSHNMAAVQQLCSRAIVLENGQLAFQDTVSNAIGFYQEKNKKINECYEGSDENSKPFFVKKAWLSNKTDEFISVNIQLTAKEAIGSVVAIKLQNASNLTILTSIDTDQDLSRFTKAKGEFVYQTKLPVAMLVKGTYYISISLSDMKSERYEYLDNIISFEIESNNNTKNTFQGREGAILPIIDWEFSKL